MRTAHVFIFAGDEVVLVADPALAVLKRAQYLNEWIAGGASFVMVEVPYEDDKLRPSQCQQFGPSGTMVSLHQRELG